MSTRCVIYMAHYTIRRWPMRPHFWVTLFGSKDELPKEIQRTKECNTLDEARAFVRSVRRKLPKGVRLKMNWKEI